MVEELNTGRGPTEYERGYQAAKLAAVEVAEAAARRWRDFAKMSLPVAPSPIINEDRAKTCEGVAAAIASMQAKDEAND